MALAPNLSYFAQTSDTFDKLADTNAIYFAVAGEATGSTFNSGVVMLLGAYGLGTTSSDANYSIAKDSFKAQAIEIGQRVGDNLNAALASPKAAGFTQRAAAEEAATIFSSFNITNILVQYTEDDSVMFEFVRAGVYFLLEIFEDGDIAYLLRRGREEPVADDICREDLYATIESVYDTIVEGNVR